MDERAWDRFERSFRRAQREYENRLPEDEFDEIREEESEGNYHPEEYDEEGDR